MTHSHDTTIDRLETLIKSAKSAGAHAVEAVFAKSRSLSISVRKAELETVERDETSDLGLRVIIGKKQAVVAVSEFSKNTLDRLVERSIAMAKCAPDDDYIGLAEPQLQFQGQADYSSLDIFDPSDISAEALKLRAIEADLIGVGFDPRIQSDAASTGYGLNEWHYLSSDGFFGHHKTSLFFQSARFIATDENGAMEREAEGRSKRHYSDLPEAKETGLIAAERALSALGARKIDSQKAPVIFDPRVSKSLIGQFIGAISGAAIARGSSFLKDKLGKSVFSPKISVIDDPFRVRGLGSCYYDDEGVAVSRQNLIKDGVLTTWLLNSASAKQLGLRSSGHASRGLAGPAGISTHNVTLTPGEKSQAQLMQDAGKGVLITSMFGPSVNADTGDWSAGASGFWFEGGIIQYPVNEITVAGNLIDIFARLIAGSDLEIKGTLDCPSILVDNLSLGGK